MDKLITAMRSERITFSVQGASLTLLYYDYILTWTDEVNYIWRKPWRLTTLLYVCCRYALVANLVYMLAILKEGPINCNVGYIIAGVLSIFGHIGILVTWGLRTSAICSKNKIITAILGLLGLSVIVLLIVRAPFNRCKGPVVFPGIRGAISALMLAWEVLAFAFAAFYAWRTAWKDLKFWENPKASLNYVVFSQGLVYISAVFALSAVSLSLNWKVPVIYSRLLNSLKLPLSGFLTARFILRLRMWEENKIHASRATLPYYLSTNAPNMSTGFDFNHGNTNSEGEVTPDRSTIEASRAVSTIDELGGDIGPKPTYSTDYPEEPIESPSSMALKSFEQDTAGGSGTYQTRRSGDDLGTAEDVRVVCAPQLDYQSPASALLGTPSSATLRSRAKSHHLKEAPRVQNGEGSSNR